MLRILILSSIFDNHYFTPSNSLYFPRRLYFLTHYQYIIYDTHNVFKFQHQTHCYYLYCHYSRIFLYLSLHQRLHFLLSPVRVICIYTYNFYHNLSRLSDILHNFTIHYSSIFLYPQNHYPFTLLSFFNTYNIHNLLFSLCIQDFCV